MKEGFGTLYLTNGEKFVGLFKSDMLNGNGSYHKNNREVIVSIFFLLSPIILYHFG